MRTELAFPHMSKSNRADKARSPLDHDPDELRRRRVAAGFRLVDVAERANISVGHVGELEKGKRNPSPRALARLAVALGCKTEDLMAKRAPANAA